MATPSDSANAAPSARAAGSGPASSAPGGSTGGGGSTTGGGSTSAGGPAAPGTAARRKARDSTSIFEKPGENIGGFVVRGEIGRGGAGRVLEAVDPRLRRKVALKQLLPE